MKSIILQAKIIPGTPRRQAVADLIAMAKEMDCMLEVSMEHEGVVLHVLPTSQQDQTEKMLIERVGA